MEEVNLSFTDVLAELVREHEAEQVAYLTPTKWVRFWEVLVPEGWEYQGLIWEWWLPDGKGENEMWYAKRDTILHGHTYETCCRPWTYCHVYGYMPTGAEGPKFIQNFKKKWGYD